MFYVEADKNKAWCTQRELLTTGSVGLDVELSFSDDWDGLQKFAIFRAYDISEAVFLTSNTAEIPARVLTKPDVNLMIGIYGINTQGTVVIPTVWADLGCIREGANLTGAENYETPPETLYAQILALATAAQASAAAATTGTYAGTASFEIDDETGHLILSVTSGGTTSTSDLGKVVGDSVSAQDLADAIASATATATASATAAATSASNSADSATAAAGSASAAATSASTAASTAATKQTQHKIASATLSANNTTWSNVSVTGVTASNTVIVTPDPSTFEAWVNAGVYCYSQGSGTLTFKALAAPSVSVKANILILD